MKKWSFELVPHGDTLVLTQPETKFRAVYSKQFWRTGGLALKERSATNDYDLLAEAWNAANDKARELGWIV